MSDKRRNLPLEIELPCRGKTDLFYPQTAERPETRESREKRAKALCELCVLKQECLSIAIQREEYGIWGGTNEDERKIDGYPAPSDGITRAGRRELRNQN